MTIFLRRKNLVAAKLKPESGSDVFLAAWRLYGSPKLVLIPEFQFAKPRQWRFDFATYGNVGVGIEIDGGTFRIAKGRRCKLCGQSPQGRHNRGKGFTQDCEKLNTAAERGWRVIRFTIEMLERDPIGCCEQVIRACKSNH